MNDNEIKYDPGEELDGDVMTSFEAKYAQSGDIMMNQESFFARNGNVLSQPYIKDNRDGNALTDYETKVAFDGKILTKKEVILARDGDPLNDPGIYDARDGEKIASELRRTAFDGSITSKVEHYNAFNGRASDYKHHDWRTNNGMSVETQEAIREKIKKSIEQNNVAGLKESDCSHHDDDQQPKASIKKKFRHPTPWDRPTSPWQR